MSAAAPWPIVHLTGDEAVAALRAGAFTEPPEQPDVGAPAPARRRIHTYAGMLGADWDIAAAEEFVRGASDIGWTTHLIGHDLAAVNDGRQINFDVPRPERGEGVMAEGG